jgi:hypothetical protein
MGTVGKRKPSFAKLAVSTTESIRTRRATKSLVTDLPDPKLADEKLKYKMGIVCKANGFLSCLYLLE